MGAHAGDLSEGLIASGAGVEVTLDALDARFSLRAGPAEAAAIGSALGLDLPGRIGQRGTSGETEVLSLGPDEWVIRAPVSEAGRIAEACADTYGRAPHSLVETSDREVTLRVRGPRALELLTLGCPRDLDRLSEGEARRTFFDGVTVVLWRDGAGAFRLDVWRSFAPHVIELLATGCRELSADEASPA